MAAYDGWSVNGGGFNGTQTGFPFGGTDVGALDQGLFAGIGRSDRPQFDEYTGSLRAPLSAYAGQADRGNVQAAAAYQESLGLFRDAQRRYGASRGIGVNDATATAALRIADERGRLLSKDLLTTTDSYVDRFNSYLASQAKQRGYSPDHLIGEEDELDSAFRTSYHKYREASKNNNPRGLTDLDGTFSKVPGFEHDMSLRIREALNRYEGANGLYSTIDRAETLDEAARLLDRIHGNSKLNARLGRDYDKIIDMAAKRVLKGDRTANLIDLIDGDIASVSDGFVTYSGTTAGDTSHGFEVKDRTGRAFTSGLAPLVQGVLVDQAIDDRLAGRERFSDERALRGRLIDSISRRYSAAGLGYDADTQGRVWGEVADNIVSMAKSGGVNLSKLADLWIENPGYSTPELPNIGTLDWNKIGAFGDKVIDQVIGERPAIKTEGLFANGSAGLLPLGFATKVTEWLTGEKLQTREPISALEAVENRNKHFYDLGTIRKDLRNQFYTHLQGYGFDKEVLGANAPALHAYVDRLADLVLYANKEGDPWVAGPGTRAEYKQGARTMLAALTMTQNLRDIGFDVPTFKYDNTYVLPGKISGDKGHRYRDQRIAFDNAFKGLDQYLDGYINSVKNPEALDDQSFLRYQAALSYKDGIKAMRSALDGSVTTADARAAKLAYAQTRLGLNLGVDGYNGASVAATALTPVTEAWAARNAKERAKSRLVSDPNMLPAREMLDKLLVAGFSDRTNPVQDRRVRELAVDFMDDYGTFIKGDSYDSWLNCVQQAVASVAGDLGTFRKGVDEAGTEYEAWDPLEPYLGNADFKKAVKAKILPTLEAVAARSKILQDKANQNIALATELRTRASRSATLAVNEEHGL